MGKILFNRAPFLGTEFKYIQDAIESAHISGDGKYTKLCNEILEQRTGTQKALLYTAVQPHWKWPRCYWADWADMPVTRHENPGIAPIVANFIWDALIITTPLSA